VSTFDLAEPASLKDDIWLSLQIRRGSFYQRPDRGSEFHTIKKATTGVPARAEAMAKRALQWLVEAGRISAATPIIVSAALVTEHRLQLDVRVIGADGQPIDLTTFVPVGAIS
jgi:phage gp46-like protein